MHQLNTELSPQHRLNRLEHEHGYLAEQNSHLNRELSSARHTIATLRTITVQKEKSLQAVQQELDQAYFRIRLLSMTLARHLLSHQHAEEGSGPIQLDRQDAFEGYMDKGRVNSS
ncbi:hypothetical protein BX666DRAFT_1873668 [Dichotomocladium elegans]|nr:hypothetical protein BX666DRAFT_1873668 [Dichotomocladium elegans]